MAIYNLNEWFSNDETLSTEKEVSLSALTGTALFPFRPALSVLQ